MIFDLLSLDGEDLTHAPYCERRARLEALDINGVYWQTPETFVDGQSLFDAVCEHELEGVVAKRKESGYRPGERGWLKVKIVSTGGTNWSESQRSTLAGNASFI
jgi:bifunctional non-homologous end joining protein LigD